MTLGRVGVVVAARTRSSRLPAKALLPLQGMPMIVFLLRRLSRLKGATVVFATTQLDADDRLAALVEAEGVPVFRGADADVVERYVGAAERFGFDTVARVTGDCPFVNAELLEWCFARAAEFDDFDLATTKSRFPVGLDTEIYRAERMAALHAGDCLTALHREHLTLYFYDHGRDFVIRAIEPPADWRLSKRHFTVDTAEDYAAAAQLAAGFEGPRFSIGELIARATTCGASV